MPANITTKTVQTYRVKGLLNFFKYFLSFFYCTKQFCHLLLNTLSNGQEKEAAKKKKKYTHKGRGYFSGNDYNNYFYDYIRHGRKRQRGSFLNRNDFAYAGRDTVNQASKNLDKLAPKSIDQLMNRATGGLDKISAKRVEQIKQIAPGLIKGAVEELYKTPFRLLGNMGRKKYKLLKKKASNKLNKLKI